jgi:acetoin utilization deacetylase AcuC-like enzyme
MLKVAYSRAYKYELPEGHRFPMEKYELLPQQLLYEGTLYADNFFKPDSLTREELLTTHLPAYYDALSNHTYTKKDIRKIGFPISDQLVDRGHQIAGGTYQCAAHAMSNGISLNIAGGTHHAYPDHGEGFCVFNDIAVASNLLLQHGRVERILIVDLDVHQGNGNAYIFKSEPRVFTFSMHGAKNYPLHKEASDLDIGLPDQADDDLYMGILKDTLPRLVNHIRPQIIFYQSGVDILDIDRLGRLNISKSGLEDRNLTVLKLCYQKEIPLVVTMGGGYAPKVNDIIDAHANVFRLAQEIYF